MAKKITFERAGELMKAVLLELKNAGGEATPKDIIATAEPKLQLSEYEKGTDEKTGYVRWVSVVHFYSIECTKAGFITQAGRKWQLTKTGEEALAKPPLEFIQSAVKEHHAYKQIKYHSKRTLKISRQLGQKRFSNKCRTIKQKNRQ